jgi:hypothetical protein
VEAVEAVAGSSGSSEARRGHCNVGSEAMGPTCLMGSWWGARWSRQNQRLLEFA